MRAPTSPLASSLIVGACLLVIVAFGLALRAQDPLSSPALGAEDPFTHVVFTKEALARGWFGDSFHLGTPMYPPGLHALAGTLASMSGVPIYAFARFVPFAFGFLAIVGTFLLANRLGGAPAGLVAALLVAAMPEHVFRTVLFFPTALDLALLPGWLLLFHLATTGEGPFWSDASRVGAGAFFLVGAGALALAHPWVVVLFGLPLGLYATLRSLRARGAPSAHASRLAPAFALLAIAGAIAMASRWSKSGTGFADFFQHMGPLRLLAALEVSGFSLFVALLVVLGVAAVVAVAVAAPLLAASARVPRVARVLVAAAAAVGVVVVALVLSQDLPLHVHYPSMLTPVAVVLALVGVAVAFLAPSALGDMGLAVALVLFPLTAIDFLDSPFWPERTVAYFSVGVALLAAAPLHFATSAAVRRVRAPRPRAWVAPTAALVSVLLVAGAVAARPAPVYEWYRLYDSDEFDGFLDLAAFLGAHPDAKAVVWSWQAGLMVKSLAAPEQARFSREFFQDADVRSKVLAENDHSTKFVVVDEHVAKAESDGKADLSFLERGGYRSWYRAPGGFEIFRVEGGS